MVVFHYMLIIVGSTRSAKVEATREAIALIGRVDERFGQATLQPVDVTDVAPTMPMTDGATPEGARLRAQTLIDRASPTTRPNLTIGLEGGLDPLPSGDGRYALKTWAAAFDGTHWGFGAGGAIVLPDRMIRRVLNGFELGDVVDEMAGAAVRGTRGAWGVLTLDLIGRQDSFRSALLAALAPFYNPAIYQG